MLVRNKNDRWRYIGNKKSYQRSTGRGYGGLGFGRQDWPYKVHTYFLKTILTPRQWQMIVLTGLYICSSVCLVFAWLSLSPLQWEESLKTTYCVVCLGFDKKPVKCQSFAKIVLIVLNCQFLLGLTRFEEDVAFFEYSSGEYSWWLLGATLVYLDFFWLGVWLWSLLMAEWH